jgi:lysophospholipase L1-like esterase
MTTVINPAPRWIMLTDSIQTEVMDTGPATALTAMQLPGLVDIVPQLIGAPGLRMTDGGTPGFGAASNKNSIGMASGYSHAAGILIMLGTNDWSNPGTTGAEFSTDYEQVVSYAQSLGLVVVCVSPLWRADESAPIVHADSTYWLANFRTTIQAVAGQAGAKFIDGTLAPCTSQPALYADGIHLNQAGHMAFAPWLVTQMQSLGFWAPC